MLPLFPVYTVNDRKLLGFIPEKLFELMHSWCSIQLSLLANRHFKIRCIFALKSNEFRYAK